MQGSKQSITQEFEHLTVTEICEVEQQCWMTAETLL
jgi:hypothetical protein